MDKRDKEWNKQHDILYSISYRDGHPEYGAEFVIYNKSGGVQARVKLDERMVTELRDRLVNELFQRVSE